MMENETEELTDYLEMAMGREQLLLKENLALKDRITELEGELRQIEELEYHDWCSW